MSDYTKMWTELGLDLKNHDVLLSVLGNAYSEVFLSQENRPEGMKYFDFVMSEIHGLRIKELVDAKAEGRKVIGSYCVFVPEELNEFLPHEFPYPYPVDLHVRVPPFSTGTS